MSERPEIILELAKMATQGTWRVGKSTMNPGFNIWRAEDQTDITAPDACLSLADAMYIAAATPATIAEYMRRLIAAGKLIAGLRDNIFEPLEIQDLLDEFDRAIT